MYDHHRDVCSCSACRVVARDTIKLFISIFDILTIRRWTLPQCQASPLTAAAPLVIQCLASSSHSDDSLRDHDWCAYALCCSKAVCSNLSVAKCLTVGLVQLLVDALSSCCRSFYASFFISIVYTICARMLRIAELTSWLFASRCCIGPAPSRWLMGLVYARSETLLAQLYCSRAQ